MKFIKRFNSAERLDILKKSKQCLWTNEGKPALEYLVQTRKVSKEVIRIFELGYIPTNVNHQLSGRVIFPIYDPSRNLVALSSRLITGESELPIYWHESYEKGFYLYGIHLSNLSMRKWKFCLLVEGQFDCIRLYDNGMTNVVALCGSKFSDVQLAMIYRYCEEIIVILDSDQNQSGQKAIKKIKTDMSSKAHKIGDSTFNNDFQNKIATITFEEYIDPDEFIHRYGIEPLKCLIKDKLHVLRAA